MGACFHGDAEAYTGPDGKRYCKACRRERQNKWYADNRLKRRQDNNEAQKRFREKAK